jgi:hypothetical protein
MSSLLALASEFLDRMSNPAFGVQVNEDYATRFATLIDESDEERLAGEIAQLRSASELTANGWSWLLGWVRAHPEVRVRGATLLDVCEHWESATFKADVIETAIVAPLDFEEERPGVVEGVPNPWLQELVSRAVLFSETSQSDEHDEGEPGEDVGPRLSSRHIYSLLLALLQVGDDQTLQAATALLGHRWAGQESLREFVTSWLQGLDPQTRAMWSTRLQL